MTIAFAICAGAQRPEDAVKAAYIQYANAIRDGDMDLYLRMRSRQSLAKMPDCFKDALRKTRPRPDWRDEPMTVRTVGGEAVVIGKITRTGSAPNHHMATFLFEDQAWKADREWFGNVPFHPNLVFAVLPPRDGAFRRAGSPWQSISQATLTNDSNGNSPWKIQATADEGFLYLRFESPVPLPPPGSEVVPATTVAAPPTLIIRRAVKRDMLAFVDFAPSTRSTFDKDGKALPDKRTSAHYRLSIDATNERGVTSDAILNDHTDDGFRTISVRERFIDITIPLQAISIDPVRPPQISLQKFNSQPRLAAYPVKLFRR